MDPDANWKEQEQIRALMAVGTADAEDRARLKELRAALDGWIARGGYKPKGYKPRGSRPRRNPAKGKGHTWVAEDYARTQAHIVRAIDDVRPGDQIPYGHLQNLSPHEKPDATDFLMLDYLAGSDYSGGSVTKSNHDVFMEEFGDIDGVHEVYGGHGSYGVAIRLDALEASEEMQDTLNGLEDYPVIDDDALGREEMEREDEAWSGWAESDFKRELRKKFPELEDDIDDASSDGLYDLLREGMERSNTYWLHESGDSVSLDITRIVRSLKEDDLGEHLKL